MSSEIEFPYVAPTEIIGLVGSQSYGRGVRYADTGRVMSLSWNPDLGHLSARVIGSRSASYEVGVHLGHVLNDDHTDEFVPETGDCSCPMRFNCKHVAAALTTSNAHNRESVVADLSRVPGVTTGAQLTAPNLGGPPRHRAPQPHTPPAPSVPTWQTTLQAFAVAEPRQPETTPLALGFELWARFRNNTHYYSTSEKNLAPEDLKPGVAPRVRLRPLVPGKRGNWIKRNIKWSTIIGGNSSLAFDTAQTEWFGLFHQLFASSPALGHYYGDHVELDEFASPRLWRMLDWAAELGIPLIGASKGLTVRRATSAQVRLDTRSEPSSCLRVRPEILIDDDVYARGTALPIADHGFYGFTVKKKAIDLVLARSETPLGRELRSVLADEAPIEIPSAQVPQFFAEVYPRIGRSATIVSGDDSVTLPQLTPPQLRLDARFGRKAHTLSLDWSWQYHNPARRLPLIAGPEEDRDRSTERAVLGTVRKLWPGIGVHPNERLEGLSTADFTARVLPELEALGEVVIHIDGERPDYEELESDPHIRVSAAETHDNDWFDLGFEITIEGKPIPFVDLFRALAAGESHLLLIDGSYFALDHPAFDKLRALLAEAEALGEWNPGESQISRYQAGLWAELEDLADDSEMAETWRASIAALSGTDPLTEVAVPAGLRADLRPYQVEGFRWLAFLWRNNLGGILADDMGLGKTVQTLGLIAHARHSAAQAEPGQTVGQPPFLVVAPTSVVGNWASEAARFTPDLTITVLDATAKKRRRTLADAIAGADVVVTSYAVLRLDGKEFRELEWAGLILDEAQFVKNSAAKGHQVARRVRAPFRLAITGTPMENSLSDLWSLAAIASPGLFPSQAKFRDEFIKPIESGEAPEKMRRLQTRVRPFMLRRTKELVAAELPAKQEQMLSVDLEPAHRRLYDTVLQRERKKLLGLLGDMDKNRFVIFKSLTLLRMLALDPAIVDGAGIPGYENLDAAPSSKLRALFDHLGDIIAEGHRALVFSQFTSFLSRIAARFDEEGIAYAYIDGSTRSRADVIDAFRTGTAPVFLISLKAGGFGLTLTEADYVFLMDPWWNPATENQAIDRAHRIGQTKNVMVYRLIAESTIEEKVIVLQQRKAELFTALMGDGQAFSSAITAADIRELLGEGTE